MHTSSYSQSAFTGWGSRRSSKTRRDPGSEDHGRLSQVTGTLKSSLHALMDLAIVVLMMISSMIGWAVAIIGIPLLLIGGASVAVLAFSGTIFLFGEALELLFAF